MNTRTCSPEAAEVHKEHTKEHYMPLLYIFKKMMYNLYPILNIWTITCAQSLSTSY